MGIDSIRYKTYNNVIDTIVCLSDAHKEIQTTTTGDIWDVDLEKNTKFPLCHINPVDVEISMSKKTFNFQVFVMDIVDEKGDNEQEVLSDTLQILTDLIALLKHGENTYTYDAAHGEEPRYYIDNDFRCEPFNERFDNSVSGWVIDLGIIVESVLDSCDIPIDDSTVCLK